MGCSRRIALLANPQQDPRSIRGSFLKAQFLNRPCSQTPHHHLSPARRCLHPLCHNHGCDGRIARHNLQDDLECTFRRSDPQLWNGHSGPGRVRPGQDDASGRFHDQAAIHHSQRRLSNHLLRDGRAIRHAHFDEHGATMDKNTLKQMILPLIGSTTRHISPRIPTTPSR